MAAHSRLASLDGLRGVAALVVLAHHLLLLVPDFAASYSPSKHEAISATAWVLSYTPLQIVWTGTEAVLLFFVLSGFVLTLPVAKAKRFDWNAYYAKRLVRLYAPTLVAVLVGYTLLSLRGDLSHDASSWASGRPATIIPKGVAADLTLIGGVSGRISPLWSLQWELLFSLALPAVLWLVTSGRRQTIAGVVTIVGALQVGAAYDIDLIYYLAVFGVGAITAAHWPAIRAWGEQWGTRRGRWPLAILAAVLLMTTDWWLQGLGLSADAASDWRAIPVLGCWLLVVAAATWHPLRAALSTRPAQWAGTVSFSLYLVHEPILLGVRSATEDWSVGWSIALALPVCLGAAIVFHRLVEAPFVRLASRVGRAVTARHAASASEVADGGRQVVGDDHGVEVVVQR